jgi:hypothetical protein
MYPPLVWNHQTRPQKRPMVSRRRPKTKRMGRKKWCLKMEIMLWLPLRTFW